MRSKPRQFAPLALPLGLIVLGVCLLIGCIPVPATRQLQPDWRPRPETAIGPGADKPIQPGVTPITDAFIAISTRIRTVTSGGGLLEPSVDSATRLDWSILRWFVSEDRRRFAARYQIRTSTTIYPLCFNANKQTEDRWLVLEVDEHGIVQSTSTAAQRPDIAQMTVERCIDVFDEPDRQELHSAGVLPSEEILHEAAKLRSAGTHRNPSTRPQ
ncbi:hypothetical protein BH09PLA1_BH09PLA1_05100 [soil metagenome]